MRNAHSGSVPWLWHVAGSCYVAVSTWAERLPVDKTTHTSSLMPAPSSQRGSLSNARWVHRPTPRSLCELVSLVPVLPLTTFRCVILQLSCMFLNHGEIHCQVACTMPKKDTVLYCIQDGEHLATTCGSVAVYTEFHSQQVNTTCVNQTAKVNMRCMQYWMK